MKVAILGASKNPERYSFKAMNMLREYGHDVVLVSPNLNSFDNLPCFSKISEITKSSSVDTLTMYVNAARSSEMESEILDLKPRRVIFNPGSENLLLKSKLQSIGIECLEACTLVLLRTNQF